MEETRTQRESGILCLKRRDRTRGEGVKRKGKEREVIKKGGEGGRGVIRARAHGQDDRIIWEEEAGGREAHELEEFTVAGGMRSVEKRSHRWNEPRDHHRLGFAHRHHS